jgi:NAD(P)H-hydrate epimerase
MAVPSVTAGQMREVDRVAVAEYGLGILQMMENAGRSLALVARALMPGGGAPVVVLAGGGGNGGGGLCCARHLANHGVQVTVVLDRDWEDLSGAARAQYRTLRASGLCASPSAELPRLLPDARLVIDALIGYSLRGAPRGLVAEMIEVCNRLATCVLALDVPSGVDATSGASPGVIVKADHVLTLALPKTGLANVEAEIRLADIGIPRQVFSQIGIAYDSPFGEHYCVPLKREPIRPDGAP